MAYKALYRTYRPQKFSEIIGQEMIVKTLQNEIREDKVSHAYLFSGPRGTGKTSIARVFAKALNCLHSENEEPCNECTACKEITEGTNPDVIEIDAASNNGVDEIRAMKDRIGFLPAGSKYKIYIIDEVHMLSTSAFNALLKTLEEPPKHVIFILATTEPHKILTTVLSRCQRYDFKALTASEIYNVLKSVCEKEEAKYEEDALMHIAKASDGGLRDALSYLDQALSFSGEKITEEDAATVTGTVSKQKIIMLAKAMKEKKLTESLALINDLQNSGKETRKIVSGLLEFYRDILMIKNNAIEDVFESYLEFSYEISSEELYYYIDIINDVQNKIRYASEEEIYLQVAIIRIINTSSSDLDYQKRLGELEEKLRNIDSLKVSSESNQQSTVYNELEQKFNNLLSFLSKLELHRINDRLNLLENNKNGNSSDSSTKELADKVSQLIEDVAFLKATQNSLRNEVENATVGSIDENMLSEKIEEISKKNKPSVNYTEIEKYIRRNVSELFDELKEEINDKIENLEKNIVNDENANDNKENNNYTDAIKSLENRLSEIESNMFKLISEALSKPTTKKSKAKVDEKQISFWGGDVIDVDKISIPSKKKDFDFGDLEKDKVIDDSKLDENNELVEKDKTEIEKNEINKIEEEIKSVLSEDEDVFNTLNNENNDLTKEHNEDIKEADINLKDSVNDNDYSTKDILIDTNGSINIEDNINTEDTINTDDSNIKEDIYEDEIINSKQQSEDNNYVNLFGNGENLGSLDKEDDSDETIEPVNLFGEILSTSKNKIEEERLENKKLEKQQEVKEILNSKKEEIVDNNSKDVVKAQKDNTANSSDYDDYERYDVKVLERILNDSRVEEYASEKDRILSLWKNLIDLAPSDKRGTAEILSEGEVKAVGNHEFVIIYNSARMCNQVMSRKFKRNSLRLLQELLNDYYNYLAITREQWVLKRQEYANQYVMGTKYPTLTPFTDPNLKVTLADEDEAEEMSKKIIDIFGDNVIIKRSDE